MSSHGTGIDLYWLPLGAGGRFVRWNGRIFEWAAAAKDRRDRCDLYHSALTVGVPEATFVIEQAPAWRDTAERGVVAQGAVGAQALGRFRLFRYEIRRWRNGLIPDLAERSTAQGISATTLTARDRCWSSCRWCRRRFGAATSCAPGRCGTRTRSSPG